jgi:hypothetical protein
MTTNGDMIGAYVEAKMATRLDELVLGTVNAPWKRVLNADQLERAVATGEVEGCLPHLATFFAEVSPTLVIRFADQHGISLTDLSVTYRQVRSLTGEANAALESLIVVMGQAA